MANSIEFAKHCIGILDEVYQRAAVSRYLNSGGRMVRAGRNAKEIPILKISVTGLGDHTRNVGYKTGPIAYEYETHSFGCDRAICLFTDVMDVEEGGVYIFGQIALTEGVAVKAEDPTEASAVDVLVALRAVIAIDRE